MHHTDFVFWDGGAKACCAALHVQKHLSRLDLEDHLCPCLCLFTLRVDNEGKHASWSGGSSAWDRLPKQVSGLDFNENACNSPVSFVSVHLAAEVNQAAEDEKEAAECWALSSWSRVCSLHGQRFLDTSRHTLHEFTKLILKRYPIISHHIPTISLLSLSTTQVCPGLHPKFWSSWASHSKGSNTKPGIQRLFHIKGMGSRSCHVTPRKLVFFSLL